MSFVLLQGLLIRNQTGTCGDISYLFNERLHNFVGPLLNADI